MTQKGVWRKDLYSFKGRDFISPDDLTTSELEYLVEAGIRVKQDWNNPSKREEREARLNGKRACLLFLEPSSRTLDSCRTASELQGARVQDKVGEVNNSFAKGEPWRDAFEQLGRGHGFDYYVLRTKVEGAPLYAARVLKSLCQEKGIPYSPVINAGDGRHWHPTQGVLDHQFAFSVFCPNGDWGKLKGKTIAYAGDLANSRTVHTNMRNWMRYPGIRFVFVSIDAFRMPKSYLSMLDAARIRYKEADCFDKKLLSGVDCLYLARPQKERWEQGLTPAQKLEYAQSITLLPDYFPDRPSGSPCGRFQLPLIMHALPRDKRFRELDESLIDSKFWGAYGQMEEGIYHRAALFNLIVGTSGFGDDLRTWRPRKSREGRVSFKSQEAEQKIREKYQVGPIQHGYVLDHISDDNELFHRILQLIPAPREGMYTGRVVSPARSTEEKIGWKHLIKLEDSCLGEIADESLCRMGSPALPLELAERLALLDPDMVINIVKAGRVKYKMKALFPKLLEATIPCVNESCISHLSQMENVASVFRSEDRRARLYRCDYCDTVVDPRAVGFV